jgi:hypothetical protein
MNDVCMPARRNFCFALCVFLCALAVKPALYASDGVYQTPPVLYVGDRGSLVYPLDVFIPLPESDLIFPDGFPRTEDIIINKIDIDRQRRRVTIEFQAFRTGVVSLPAIPFGSIELKGLQVNISSILDSDKASMTLSPSAGTIAAPGTFWMITAFSTLLAIGLIIIALIFAKGGAIFTGARNRLRTLILRCWINFIIRRLEKRLRCGEISEKDALALLSSGIRVFLSRFWMMPCYSLSAEEFRYLTIHDGKDGICAEDYLSALCIFFKRCDETRFGAAKISRETTSAICAEAKALVTSLPASPPAGPPVGLNALRASIPKAVVQPLPSGPK